MNFKLTMALTVVLLLALLAYLFVPQKTDTVKPAENASSTLLDPKPGDITSVSFSVYDVEEKKFVKEGDQWKMTVPVKADADNSQLGSIASSLQSLAYTQKFMPEDKGERSADYTGTAKPTYVIKFSDGKHDYTLAVGKRGTQGVFATVNGDKNIYVLDSNPTTQLDKNPNTFRNLQVVQMDQSRIATVTNKSRESDWQIAKSDDKWLVSQPVSARASDAVVQEMLRNLASIRAQNFVGLTKKEAGLDPPVSTVTISTQQLSASTAPSSGPASAPATAPAGKTVVLQIGYVSDLTADRKNSPVYAGVAGSDDVFVLGNDVVKSILKDLKDVRDPAVTPLSVIQATDFTVATDGKVTLAANQKDQNWNLTAPLAVKADALGVSDFLGNIHNLRAIKFVDGAGDLKAIGLDPPHMKIELAVPGQSQHEVILVGNTETDPDKGKVTPVMRQGESTVFLLQAADADKLSSGALTLRDKEVERLDANQIRSIVISGPLATAGMITPATSTAPATTSAPATSPAPPTGTPGITLERDGTLWKAHKDGGTPLAADESKITSLLAQFTPVFTSRYTDEKPIDGTPSVTVTVTVLESTQPAIKPAASTAPAATTSAPATAAASAPASAPNISDMLPAAVGPDAGKLVTRTLKLYKQDVPATAPATAPSTAPSTAPATAPAPAWKAVWDNQSPAWTFEPNSQLVDDVTKEGFATPAPATQPATMPATAPATKP